MLLSQPVFFNCIEINRKLLKLNTNYNQEDGKCQAIY
ncbi:hypothetical protein LYNGBM3L_41000 [Moorena producens 3L]|uniref:Uncharacterized protein n=1 Tax=Moorena producens 3L TaxID=489825 RepID=F4XVT9_9CYAN|nr:hypothetical protein LYNGBM3L_41000 [Moorena producens 3L]